MFDAVVVVGWVFVTEVGGEVAGPDPLLVSSSPAFDPPDPGGAFGFFGVVVEAGVFVVDCVDVVVDDCDGSVTPIIPIPPPDDDCVFVIATLVVGVFVAVVVVQLPADTRLPPKFSWSTKTAWVNGIVKTPRSTIPRTIGYPRLISAPSVRLIGRHLPVFRRSVSVSPEKSPRPRS